MKTFFVAVFVAVFAVLGWAQSEATGQSRDKVDKRLAQATEIIQDMTGPNAKAGIPESVLQNAKCIAVIPNMIQAGFGIGGYHGAGIATCRINANRWSAPAPLKMTGGSFGAQIGGEAIDLVMMVMNDQGMQALRSGHFKVGAEVSGAAGPVGRQAEAAGGWKAAILTYSRTKGAYAGATIKGAGLQQDDDATKELYGGDVTFTGILDGKVPAPANAEARDFMNAVQRAYQTARAQ